MAPSPVDDFKLQFASDNCSPICPEVWQALDRANTCPVFTKGYGEDPITREAITKLNEVFEREEDEMEVCFVSTGTAANALALSTICQPYHGILCHPFSHIELDEANAPEFFTGGAKLVHVSGLDGKIALGSDPAKFRERLNRGHTGHSARLRCVSITQSTEVGTLYTVDEVKQIGALIKEVKADFDLILHMDGARFANAIAALGVAAKEITWKAGVDILTFGGTKNGCPGTETIIFFGCAEKRKIMSNGLDYRRKQSGQRMSKMRYLAAPWNGLLENKTWIKYADHANKCASMLEMELDKLGIKTCFPVKTNAVFVELPKSFETALKTERGWEFYEFPDYKSSSISANSSVYRFMCTWNTTNAALSALIADIAEWKKSSRDA